MTSTGRDVVILACAMSAGIHGALAPAHFNEGAGAGVGFIAATAALASLAFLIGRYLDSLVLLVGAAGVLGGLLASYALATTTGLPVLHPDPEPVERLALATKAIEAIGLLGATSLLWRLVAVTNTQPKGTLT